MYNGTVMDGDKDLILDTIMVWIFFHLKKNGLDFPLILQVFASGILNTYHLFIHCPIQVKYQIIHLHKGTMVTFLSSVFIDTLMPNGLVLFYFKQ